MAGFKTRMEYDAYVASWPKDQQWQWWPVPWSLATWPERFVKLGLWAAGGCFVAISFLTTMALFATIIDNAAELSIEHDRCLKRATNGYEIRECR